MTTEQKETITAAQFTERPTFVIEIDAAQEAVLTELDLMDDVEDIARAAFASVVKGKMQSAIDRAIKAKWLAETKGKKALSEECESEIQKGLKLKRAL